MAFQRALVELCQTGMLQNESVFELNVNGVRADDANDGCFRTVIHGPGHGPAVFDLKVERKRLTFGAAGAGRITVADAVDKRIYVSNVLFSAIRAYNNDLLAAADTHFTRGESILTAPHFCHGRHLAISALAEVNLPFVYAAC